MVEYYLSMGVFHVFKIVQMVLNRTKCLIYFLQFISFQILPTPATALPGF